MYTKRSLSLFVFFTLLFINGSLISSAMTACVGQPASVNWTSDINAVSCGGSASRSECNFSPVAGVSGSKSVSIPGGTPAGVFCTATITCQNSSGINSSKTDTLTYDPSQTWDGTSCVTPPTISSFAASKTNVVVGETYTLTLGSSNAASCQVKLNGVLWSNLGGSNTWNGLSHGSAGSYTYTATCYSGAGQTGIPSSVSSVTITVTNAPATASLTITGAPYGTNVHSISYPAGTANTKNWSSTNGSSYSDSVRRTGACVNNSWGNTSWSPWGVATTPSGSSNGSANQNDVGCTVEISYTANSTGGNSTDSIDVTVDRCLPGNGWFGSPTGCGPCPGGCTGGGGSPGNPGGTLTCTNGGSNPPICTPPAPSGTLSASSPTCTVANGSAGCSVTFTWTTANPIGTSQVIGNGGGPSSIAANNSTQALTARYIDGVTPHTFVLYNNSTPLASENVLADCASSSAWNGSSCQACTGGCGGGATPPHSCDNGGSNPPTCTPPACANGAINAPTCTICADTMVMDGGTCKPCDNGGCGTIAPPHMCNNGGSNPPTCTPPACANGAINPPTCTVCSDTMVMDGGTCKVCSNGGCGTTAPPHMCNNGAGDPPTCTPPVTTGTLSAANSCEVSDGGTSCLTAFTWTTNNPGAGLSQVRGDGGGPDSSLANNSTESLAVRYIDGVQKHNFQLYHIVSLASKAVLADCKATSAWNGSSCQVCSNGGCGGGATPPHSCNNGGSNPPTCTPPACANGAINPPTCTVCADTMVMDGGTCKACDNGGCGTTAPPHMCNNGGSNPPTCTPPACANGAINPPTCTVCSDTMVMDGGTCKTCTGGCGGGVPPHTCNNGGPNPPTCTAPGAPSGTISFSATSCTIPTGSSQCTVNLSWDTLNPVGISQITRTNSDGTTAIDYTQNKGDNLPVSLSGRYDSANFFLYNNSIELATQHVTVSCAAGAGKWDSISGKCTDVQVVSVVKSGEHYPPGNLAITCNPEATGWVVLKDGAPFKSGVYSGATVNVSVSVSATYTTTCKQGTAVSSPVPVWYEAGLTDPKVSLLVSPKTIAKGASVTLSWSGQYPIASCAITAKVVCTNSSCDANQTKYEKDINDILKSNTEKTDANDPNGSRALLKSMYQFAPGHGPTDIPSDYKALGKRTLTGILYTTDFTYKCATGNKETQRVQVTRSNEG